MFKKFSPQITKSLVLSSLIASASVFALAYPYSLAYAAEDDFTAPDPTPEGPPLPNSETVESALQVLPPNTPEYFRRIYPNILKQPLPARIFDQGGVPTVIPKLEIDTVPNGQTGSYQPLGQTVTSQNAFFESLGTNGRSCVTCHQPASGMSISLRNILKRMNRTLGTDPLFAPVDGANCPTLVPKADTSGSLIGGFKSEGEGDFKAARSLLLNKGLIRVFMPTPTNAEFTVKVISDPTTCNTDPRTNSEGGDQIISMYRRPLISASLHFKRTAIGFPPGSSAPPQSGNIMWDGREPTLESQAVSATLGHAQAIDVPSAAKIKEIVDFEVGIFSAQYSERQAGVLKDNGGKGGPENFSDHRNDAPSFPAPPNPFIAFTEYDGWINAPGDGTTKVKRESIARGQALFNGVGKDGQGGNTKGSFTINGVAGFNDLVGPNATGTCATCHNFKHSGSDILPFAQRDIGIGGQGSEKTGAPGPKPDLPIFEVSGCGGKFVWDASATSTRTNDLGRAMVTGLCKDVGASTVPQLRALSSHEPYFRDGSARTLRDVVSFYNTRFNIGLTDREKDDLANFLSAL